MTLVPDLSPSVVAGCVAVFWQADQSGAYDDTGVRLRRHQFTDARGHYWLRTILPEPDANRTRHLHVTVRARGERTVTTMLYFSGVALKRTTRSSTGDFSCGSES